MLMKNNVMKVEDRIYGDVEISEPVLLDIINCSALQRLKDVDQAGYLEPYFPGGSFSRFEHSVGVCLFLKRYGASIEEQVFGLIHDVSHSAFSHCIDHVLHVDSEKKQSHQDSIFTDFVKKTEIPMILEKYGFDPNHIFDDSNFPLMEKDLPDLCADRIDYSLRTARVLGKIEGADYFFDNLISENGDWFFKDFESAKKYTDLFLEINTDYYAGLFSAVMFCTVKDYLRHAISRKYISESDLYTTDILVLSKIKPYHKDDELLALLFDRMNGRIGFRNDPSDFDAEVVCKSRAVDPFCKYNGGIKRVSCIDSQWDTILESELKPKRYFVKFER